jgi:hypothetical protein
VTISLNVNGITLYTPNEFLTFPRLSKINKEFPLVEKQFLKEFSSFNFIQGIKLLVGKCGATWPHLTFMDYLISSPHSFNYQQLRTSNYAIN